MSTGISPDKPENELSIRLSLISNQSDTATINSFSQNDTQEKSKTIHQMQENISMVQSPSNMTKTDTDSQSKEDSERVISQESLFERFAFENNINEAETEKCLTFWRNVMEKSLEPLKCALIEKHQSSSKKKDFTKTKNTNLKNGHSNKVTGKGVQVAKIGEKRDKWFEILKELQKRKLHQTRLTMEKKCKYCNYITSEAYKHDDVKKDTKQLIKEMSDWEPKSVNRGEKSSKTRAVKEVFQAKQDQSDSEIDIDENKKAKEEIINEVKSASKKIKHIDAVNKKKSLGIYSKWRKNKNSIMCKCQRQECDCNVNPAVKRVSDHSFSSLPNASLVSSVEKLENLTHDKEEQQSVGSQRRPSKGSRSSKKSLSVFFGCTCSTETCDCRPVLFQPEKEVTPKTDESLPPLPTNRKEISLNAKSVDSLEIIRRRLSSVVILDNHERRDSLKSSLKKSFSEVQSKSEDDNNIQNVKRLSYRRPTQAEDKQNSDHVNNVAKSVSIHSIEK